MRYKLSAPLQPKAVIELPASKSISNRALIIHALGRGTTVPANLSDCDDTRPGPDAAADADRLYC